MVCKSELDREQQPDADGAREQQPDADGAREADDDEGQGGLELLNWITCDCLKYSSKCTEYQIYKMQSLPKPLTLYPIFDTISDNYQCKKNRTTLKLTLYPIRHYIR